MMNGCNMMSGMMGNFVGGGTCMLFMLLFWLLIIIGIVLLVVWLVSQVTGTAKVKEEQSALEILKQRYARGEINKEEFEQKKKDLI